MTLQPEKRAGRNKPNYLYSIASVALVLFLIGLFGLVVLHANRLVSIFKERISIMVELEENVTANNIKLLERELRRRPFVKPNTLQYISRETAAKNMQDDFGDDFLKLGLPNPFYDVFLFNVNAAYMRSDSLLQIRTALTAQYPFINDVFYQESVVESVGNNIQRISYFLLGVGIFLIIVAAALIHNTVRLALYANRFIIKNMELVGASWEFISKPYLVRSIFHGFLSGLLAVVGLTLTIVWSEQQLPDLKEMRNVPGFATLFAGLIVLGILINLVSTYYVVRKYLQMRVDDLY